MMIMIMMMMYLTGLQDTEHIDVDIDLSALENRWFLLSIDVLFSYLSVCDDIEPVTNPNFVWDKSLSFISTTHLLTTCDDALAIELYCIDSIDRVCHHHHPPHHYHHHHCHRYHHYLNHLHHHHHYHHSHRHHHHHYLPSSCLVYPWISTWSMLLVITIFFWMMMMISFFIISIMYNKLLLNSM